MSNAVHNYLENKTLQLDKVIREKRKMEFASSDMTSQASILKADEDKLKEIDNQASILKADEDRLKEIAKAFAKNEQRIVVKEIDTDILMEEIKHRFDTLQMKLNSIKNAMGEE